MKTGTTRLNSKTCFRKRFNCYRKLIRYFIFVLLLMAEFVRSTVIYKPRAVRPSLQIMSLLSLLLILSSYAGVIGSADGKKCYQMKSGGVVRRSFHLDEKTYPITLDSSDRLSHKFSNEIFRIFLQEALGYDMVQIVHDPDISYFNTSVVLQRLDIGEKIENREKLIPKAVINLEVWFPPQLDSVAAAENAMSDISGSSYQHSFGRIGWFLLNASVESPFVSYTILQDKKNPFGIHPTMVKKISLNYTPTDKMEKDVRRFPNETLFVPKQCEGEDDRCSLLIATYPDESAWALDIIKKHELTVKVLWLGKEMGRFLLDYEDKWKPIPILVLYANPSVLNMYKLTSIMLPECSVGDEKCIGYGRDINILQKISSTILRRGAKIASQALKNFHLKEEQLNLLFVKYRAVAVSRKDFSKEDEIIRSIACEWVSNNTDEINNWRPVDSRSPKEYLNIGAFLPPNKKSSIYLATIMAMNYINRNTSLLPNHTLQLLLHTEHCDSEDAFYRFIEWTKSFSNFVGILGPTCPKALRSLPKISSNYYKTPLITYSPVSFFEKNTNPYVFHIMNEEVSMKTSSYCQLMKAYKWRRMATLVQEGYDEAEYLTGLQQCRNYRIKIASHCRFSRLGSHSRQNIIPCLQNVIDNNLRVIAVEVDLELLPSILCEAFLLKMFPENGFVWFLPSWMDEWSPNTIEVSSMHCSIQNISNLMEGHFLLAVSDSSSPPDAIMQENKTIGNWWRNEFHRECMKRSCSFSRYASYAYDAVWMYAHALSQLNRMNDTFISNVHDNEIFVKYISLLSSTKFSGLSGFVEFPNIKPADILILQRKNHSLRTVYIFNTSVEDHSKGLQNGSFHIEWVTHDKNIPTDGQTCWAFLEIIGETFRTDCDNVQILLFLLTFFIVSFAAIVVFIKYKFDKKVKLAKRFMKKMGINLITETLLSDLDMWEIDRKYVVINRKLGEGEFGLIYGGEALLPNRGWVAVAVKTLKSTTNTEKKLAFLSEAEIMKRFNHENIVQILAVCNRDEPLYNIMEFMLYGDLKNYLLSRRHLVKENSDEISSEKLTKMTLDVARALQYISEMNYVHRDLACRNCMVGENQIVKLGDFGMARCVQNESYYRFNRQGVLPVRWMAPESLSDGVFTCSSDIWSFGVLLYEIITFGGYPYQGFSNNQVLQYVRNGNMLNIPANVNWQLKLLMISCWNLEGKKRPKAAKIVEILEKNKKLIQPYLEHPNIPNENQLHGRFNINRYININHRINSNNNDYIGDQAMSTATPLISK